MIGFIHITYSALVERLLSTLKILQKNIKKQDRYKVNLICILPVTTGSNGRSSLDQGAPESATSIITKNFSPLSLLIIF